MKKSIELSVYIHCLCDKTRPSISFSCAVIIQGLVAAGIRRISTNFRSDVHVEGNCSIGKPIISAFEFTQEFKADECDFIIVDDNIVGGSFDLAPEIWKTFVELAKATPVAVINCTDGSNAANYPRECTQFISHLSSQFRKDPNAHSLPFGLTNELIELSSNLNISDNSRDNRSLFLNFGRTTNQSVRQVGELSFIRPFSEKFLITRTNERGIRYAEQLIQYAGIFCYGGTFIWQLEEWFREHNPQLYWGTSGKYLQDVAVVRWDSWRFWEACVFGCAPIHLDFAKYGFILPDPPKPWFDYIPLSFDDPRKTLTLLEHYLQLDDQFLTNIGRNARNWALRSYTPIEQAIRLIRAIGINVQIV